MQIKLLNNSFSSKILPCSLKLSKVSLPCKSSDIKIENISAEVIKANFAPTFGKYRKVADVTLIDKDTEMPVRASLRKEQVGDFISFQIITDKKDEAGFLHMDIEPLEIDGEYIPKNKRGQTIPEVSYIRSIKGDKYKGIGTILIRAAINESLRSGKDGELFLNAETGYGSFYSDYRKNESPIPFYYKLGFKSENLDLHKQIKACIKKADYEKLPQSTLLVLPKSAIAAKNIQFSRNYKFD